MWLFLSHTQTYSDHCDGGRTWICAGWSDQTMFITQQQPEAQVKTRTTSWVHRQTLEENLNISRQKRFIWCGSSGNHHKLDQRGPDAATTDRSSYCSYIFLHYILLGSFSAPASVTSLHMRSIVLVEDRELKQKTQSIASNFLSEWPSDIKL